MLLLTLAKLIYRSAIGQKKKNEIKMEERRKMELTVVILAFLMSHKKKSALLFFQLVRKLLKCNYNMA